MNLAQTVLYIRTKRGTIDGYAYAWTTSHRTTWALPFDKGIASAAQTAGHLQPMIGTTQQ